MDIILLCAGTSSRMQTGDKLLFDAGGISIVCRSAMSALYFIKTLKEQSRLIVVTGHRSDEVLSSLSKAFEYADKNSLSIITVNNDNYIQGQTSSTKKGISLVKNSDFFVSLGDMPLVKPEHYTKIMSNLKNYDAVRPLKDSKPGHPVLFSNRIKDKILSLKDEESIRTIMSSIKTKNLTLEDEACFTDCDTPQDYCKLLLRFGN